MEATAFCASRSFVKSPNLAIGSSPHFSKRPKRGAIITCSGGRYSDEGEEKRPSSDWRTFRARLFAAEQSGVITVNPPAVPNRWAHSLHSPEKGCLLIASPKLDGVHIFERAIILLFSTSPTPTGVILNRPSLMSIKEASKTNSPSVFADRPLLFGGPVKGGFFLLTANAEVAGSGVFDEVIEGVHYGERGSVGCAAEMVNRNVAGAAEFAFFDGSCGWENRQLRDEVADGYWSVAACGGGMVEMCVGRAEAWKELVGIMGHRNVW